MQVERTARNPEKEEHEPGCFTTNSTFTPRKQTCSRLLTTDLSTDGIYVLPGQEVCQNNLH